MSLAPRTRLAVGQRLGLGPGMRMSLRVLALPVLDLADLARDKAAENPLLIVEMPDAPPAVAPGDGGWFEALPARPNLPAHLRRQIMATAAPRPIRELASFLALDLTEEGYLPESPEDIGHHYGIPAEDVSRALALLRDCEPVGIGARDLAHCLALQLAEATGIDAGALTPHIADLARGIHQPAERALGLPKPRLVELQAMLPRLDPSPGRTWTDAADPLPRPPDLIARPGRDGVAILELVQERAPRISVDHKARARMAEAGPAGAEMARSLGREADLFVAALQRRATTLLRIGGLVLDNSPGLMEQGPVALRPLTLGDLAEKAQLHVSTVSRAVAGKVIALPSGTFALRDLLGAGLPNTARDHDMAAPAVRAMLARLVHEEPPGAPLSDAELARRLSACGVDIARRTVAKYRSWMRIPPSPKRRRRPGMAGAGGKADRPARH